MKSPSGPAPGAPPRLPPVGTQQGAHASRQQEAQEEGRAVVSQAFSIKHAIFSSYNKIYRLFLSVSAGKKTASPIRTHRLWCGQWDSNPHGLLHRNLNPARLPIPPYPHIQFPSIFTREGDARGGASLLVRIYKISWNLFLSNQVEIIILSIQRTMSFTQPS